MALIKKVNPDAFVKAARNVRHKIRKISDFASKISEEESASAISDDSFSVGNQENYVYDEEDLDDLGAVDEDDGGDDVGEGDEGNEENIDEIIANEADGRGRTKI